MGCATDAPLAVQGSSAAPLCEDRTRRIKSAGYHTPNQKQIPHNLERVAIAFQFYNASTIRQRLRGPSISHCIRNESLFFRTQNKDNLQHNAQPSWTNMGNIFGNQKKNPLQPNAQPSGTQPTLARRDALAVCWPWRCGWGGRRTVRGGVPKVTKTCKNTNAN